LRNNVVEVKLTLPEEVYKWFSIIAKKDGVNVEKVIENALHEVYQFKRELRDIRRFYEIMGLLGDTTSLGQVLSYTINLGVILHYVAEHLLDGLEGGGNYVLDDIKLVEEKPGAYRGVYFEFITRDVGNSSIDYFTLQIQHDGLYLDVTSTLSFNSKREVDEAIRRLKRATMKVVEADELKSIEERLAQSGGKLNIDISDDGEIIYLTFMAYANEINALPKLHQVDNVLKMIYEVAGIERVARE